MWTSNAYFQTELDPVLPHTHVSGATLEHTHHSDWLTLTVAVSQGW